MHFCIAHACTNSFLVCIPVRSSWPFLLSYIVHTVSVMQKGELNIRHIVSPHLCDLPGIRIHHSLLNLSALVFQ